MDAADVAQSSASASLCGNIWCMIGNLIWFSPWSLISRFICCSQLSTFFFLSKWKTIHIMNLKNPKRTSDNKMPTIMIYSLIPGSKQNADLITVLKEDEKLKPNHSRVAFYPEWPWLCPICSWPARTTRLKWSRGRWRNTTWRTSAIGTSASARCSSTGKVRAASLAVIKCKSLKWQTPFIFQTSFRTIRLLANFFCVQVSHVVTDFFHLKCSDFTALIS